MLWASGVAQDQPRELKGGGHLLGETAEQFFSEGFVGDMLRACEGRKWKSVTQLYRSVDHASKANAKDICAKEKLAKQLAMSGARLEYKGQGDEETMRTDTFTFDASHLVKIDLVYVTPIANIEGYRPRSYGELFTGLQEAYGPPTASYSEPVLSAYGVRYDAQRARWTGKHDVISIIEHPGEDSRTEIIAESLAEYNRAAQAAKTANPLQ